MRKEDLNLKFHWQKWSSDTAKDLTQLGIAAPRILFDLFLINEFEHALLRLKNEDCVWGPVHTSVGQEAIAAATVHALRKSDKFAGTHRAHHQFLAKAMHYVLDDSWNPANQPLTDSLREVVRRTMAEIMGLAPGFCGGRGGSMHLRWPEAGFLGSNAIVGGGIPLATGAAFAEKRMKTGNIVVSFFSDGATNQGAFHEACNLAGIFQLPIIYFIENNGYAVATSADTACAVQDLSIRATSYGMDAYVVDGTDPAAILNATKEAADQIRAGHGPIVIEAKCYRHYHHAGDKPGSAFGYRSKEEEAAWREKDVIAGFPQSLIDASVLNPKQIAQIKSMAKAAVDEAIDFCTIAESPRKVRPELWPAAATASLGTRSDGKELEGIPYSEASDFKEFEEIRYNAAISAVTGHWLEKDPHVVVMGEEVANFGGGAYGATKGLPAKYPDRVINTPISEAGFVGLGCGAAMLGMRPIVEIMFPDFALVAADQLFNQIGKARHMYGNTTDLPLVVRTRVAVGCGYGGQHSMDPIGLYALFSGWRIVVPSNAFDYIGLFNTAMLSRDPVLFIEHHSLYERLFPVPKGNLDNYIPFGKGRLIAPGKDVTIITYGSMVLRCESVREKLAAQGVSAEIIDLRTLDLPSIDYDLIGQSLKKTLSAVVVEEAAGSQSIGRTIAANIMERFFDFLDGPVACVTSLDIPNPVSRALEAATVISDDQVFKTVSAVAKRQWK